MARERTGVLLPDAHLRAIGMVVYEWSYLEAVVEAAMWPLMFLGREELRHRGRAVTTHVAFRVRLDILLSLAHLHFDKSGPVGELKVLIDRIHKVSEKRNKIVHAFWTKGKKQRLAGANLYRARGRLTHVCNDMTAKEIRTVSEEIYDISEDMIDYLCKNNLYNRP